jgi:hypothetical protein
MHKRKRASSARLCWDPHEDPPNLWRGSISSTLLRRRFTSCGDSFMVDHGRPPWHSCCGAVAKRLDHRCRAWHRQKCRSRNSSSIGDRSNRRLASSMIFASQDLCVASHQTARRSPSCSGSSELADFMAQPRQPRQSAGAEPRPIERLSPRGLSRRQGFRGGTEASCGPS